MSSQIRATLEANIFAYTHVSDSEYYLQDSKRVISFLRSFLELKMSQIKK